MLKLFCPTVYFNLIRIHAIACIAYLNTRNLKHFPRKLNENVLCLLICQVHRVTRWRRRRVRSATEMATFSSTLIISATRRPMIFMDRRDRRRDWEVTASHRRGMQTAFAGRLRRSSKTLLLSPLESDYRLRGMSWLTMKTRPTKVSPNPIISSVNTATTWR